MLWMALLPLASATPDDTYTRLRDRLTTEYLVVGEGQGRSVPASRRVEDTHFMKWADATVQLGWYVGALAIEQALLAEGALPGFDPGRTAAESAAELAWALDAIDRLDAYPEGAFPDCDGGAGAPDGFLVRDDVPRDFHDHFEGIYGLNSDWIDSVWLKEMSQDQAVHLLLGLALVQRYTDPDLVADGVHLREQAAAAAARIGAHLGGDGDWVIRNPTCDDKAVERGAEAAFYSTGFAAAVEVASGAPPPQDPLFPDLWEELRDPDHLAFQNSDNRHMVLALVATGDSWADGWGDLGASAAVADWDAYPLLYLALHGAPAGADLADLEARAWTDLEALGDAEVGGVAEDADHPWTTWHRFIRPGEEHGVADPGEAGFGYPGLDYLLLHQLHAAVFRAEWPAEETEGPPLEEPRACGCQTAPGVAPAGLLALLLALRRRQRPG